MKITLMVVLMLTIAAISHLALTRMPTKYEAATQLSLGTERPSPRLVMGSRNMWLSIVAAVITIAAACLGIAVLVLQEAEVV